MIGLEPSVISEEDRLQEYNYCKTNEEAIKSKAGKYELFNALKEEFGNNEWKKYYEIIYDLFDGEKVSKKERELIRENIINNKEFILKLEDILYKKLKKTGKELDSEIISIETIIILLSNALVKQDASEIIGMDELQKLLTEYGFGKTIDGINNENSEIKIVEELDNYIVLVINNYNYYLINKQTKEKIECSSYEKIDFGEKEIFLVKNKDGHKILYENEEGILEEKIEGKKIFTDLVEFGYLVVEKEGKKILVNKNFEENKDYFLQYNYKKLYNFIIKAVNKNNENCFITLENDGKINEYSFIANTINNSTFIGGNNDGKIFLLKKGTKTDITDFNNKVYYNNNLFLCGETEKEKRYKGDLLVRKSDESFYGIFNLEGKELFPEEDISEFHINKYGNNLYFGIKIGDDYHLIQKTNFKSVFKTQNTKDFKKIFTSIDDDIYFKKIDGESFLEDMYGRKEKIIPREESKGLLDKIKGLLK